MLERRTFLLASSASAALHFCFGAAGARAAAAQTARKPVKVGILSGGSLSDSTASLLLRSFKDAMRDLGWIEKRNVVYVERYYEADVRKVEFLTAELDAEKVDVIFADFGRAALLAAKVAPRVPIVFGTQADPVGAGIVASLARPGGNITGMSTYNAELSAKRVELLKEMRPAMKRVVHLQASVEGLGISGQHSADAAKKLGLEFRLIRIRQAEELTSAFDEIAAWKADGLLAPATPLSIALRPQIVAHAARLRLPAIYSRADFVTIGGLMSYAADFADNFRRAAGYVDKILQGAKPADLPVQQPTRFELVINMKTVKALGLKVPPEIMVRVDRVIE
jgi:putative ABC transport system substrate-binding protein